MAKLSKKNQAKADRLYAKMVSPEPYKEPARLSITAEDLPDIKNWEVGKSYDIKLKMKMVSKSEGGYDGRQPLSATFQMGSENDPNEASEDEDEDD